MLVVVLSASILLRLLVAQWGYSGYGVPPMYGDFEAQRHWMEVTINLPIGDWYRQTRHNDLQYWGLDYPPLTAYVSQGFGTIAQQFVPQLVEWEYSRGHESTAGKMFMRFSVILSDIIIFFPALVMSFSDVGYRRLLSLVPYQLCTLLLLASIPGLLLIDHGHFQYNGVCLGFSVLGATFIAHGYDVFGSIMFCLALNFKQMALYYAPAFFFVLLRKCFTQGSVLGGLGKFITLGITVAVTFGVLWAPFCVWHSADETCLSSLLHVLQRQFPFKRGIFEDKVANLWYALSVAIDFREFLSLDQMVKCSLGFTLLLLGPICILLLRKPLTFSTIVFGLVGSSLAFFLASFQVHEKSILLAAVPAMLLFERERAFAIWFQVVSTFSMFPLLKKDGLVFPYWSVLILFVSMQQLHRAVFDPARKELAGCSPISRTLPMDWFEYVLKLWVPISFLGMFILHVLEQAVPPPPRYPDLYPALFALFSAGNFVIAYCYTVIRLASSKEKRK